MAQKKQRVELSGSLAERLNMAYARLMVRLHAEDRVEMYRK